MLHSKLRIPTPVSLPEKVKVIKVDFVLPPLDMALLLPSTPDSILVVGAVVSTVHVNDEGEGLMFSTLSFALTSRI
jgi:hypothetical protein